MLSISWSHSNAKHWDARVCQEHTQAHWNLLFHNHIITFQLLICSERLDSNKAPGDTVSGWRTQCQQGRQKSPWA